MPKGKSSQLGLDRETFGLILEVIGIGLMVAAVLFPSQSVTIILRPLGLVAEIGPDRLVITGTAIDAAVLEFILGAALFVAGWHIRRRR
jgi:hypothetical protein